MRVRGAAQAEKAGLRMSDLRDVAWATTSVVVAWELQAPAPSRPPSTGSSEPGPESRWW